VWQETFRGSLILRIKDFSGFTGRKTRIWISDFTCGNNFSWISCAVFESNKNESHMVVFVTLFATNFMDVQQCKKGVNLFAEFLLERVCFHGISLSQINEKSSKFAILDPT